MKRHRGRVNGPSVAAFLILEPLFPRSVRHAVNASLRRLQSLCPPTIAPGQRALARLDALGAALAARDPDSIASEHDIATFVVAETDAICSEISQDLFGYATTGATD